jgi:TRAP transporter TAXI family solute receptor
MFAPMPKLRNIKLSQISARDAAIIGIPALLLVLAAFWIAYQFVKPAPPDSFVLSTGREDGAYYSVGKRYQEILAQQGIQVEVRKSAGAVENLQHLADEDSDVEVGLVQAGTGAADDYPGLVTLGSVYFEPVWIFYRGETMEDHLRNLRGKRIAVGAIGSGTRKLATQLLLVNEAWSAPTHISDLGGDAASAALQKGSVDAVFLIGPAESPSISSLLRDRSIRLMSFDRAPAYTKAFPFLAAVKLPEGGINLMNNIPPRDVTLLAPTANIVVKEDFHPALVDLMMQAMAQVHNPPGVFQAGGEFPAPRDREFPLSKEAERFYKSGPPFLQRYMPFWAATLVDRIIVLLVPIVAVLLPVMKIAPWLYSWRIRSRIYRWYGELKFLELELKDHYDAKLAGEYLQRLDNLELRAYSKPTPGAFVADVYTLRQHIDMVRSLLRSKSGPSATT